jgi:hypothetical protein
MQRFQARKDQRLIISPILEIWTVRGPLIISGGAPDGARHHRLGYFCNPRSSLLRAQTDFYFQVYFFPLLRVYPASRRLPGTIMEAQIPINYVV